MMHTTTPGRALVGPLYRLFAERNSLAAVTTKTEDSYASFGMPLAAIGLVALLMLWAVIDPML